MNCSGASFATRGSVSAICCITVLSASAEGREDHRPVFGERRARGRLAQRRRRPERHAIDDAVELQHELRRGERARDWLRTARAGRDSGG